MPHDDFDYGWETFRRSAFRLETLQHYSVPHEDELWQAFTQGGPMPHRSAETSPWLREIADHTAAGRRVSVVHILDRPFSPYIRFELWGYEQNATAGQEIHLAERDVHPEFAGWHEDWWLFDDEYLVLMSYTDNGEFLGAEKAPESADIGEYVRRRDLALKQSVPLADFPERYQNHGT